VIALFVGSKIAFSAYNIKLIIKLIFKLLFKLIIW